MSKDAILQGLVGVAIFLVGGIASLVVYVVRISARWATMETSLKGLMDRVEKLVQDKDSTHRDMLSQMRTDRETFASSLRQMLDSLNIRVRYLEEHVWNQSKSQ